MANAAALHLLDQGSFIAGLDHSLHCARCVGYSYMYILW